MCVGRGEGKRGEETDMTCCLLDVRLLFFTVGYRVNRLHHFCSFLLLLLLFIVFNEQTKKVCRAGNCVKCGLLLF